MGGREIHEVISVPWNKGWVPLFAFMVGTFHSYTFKGFMEADELLKEERPGTLGHRSMYIAEQKELDPYVLPVVS